MLSILVLIFMWAMSIFIVAPSPEDNDKSFYSQWWRGILISVAVLIEITLCAITGCQ